MWPQYETDIYCWLLTGVDHDALPLLLGRSCDIIVHYVHSVDLAQHKFRLLTAVLTIWYNIEWKVGCFSIFSVLYCDTYYWTTVLEMVTGIGFKVFWCTIINGNEYFEQVCPRCCSAKCVSTVFLRCCSYSLTLLVKTMFWGNKEPLKYCPQELWFLMEKQPWNGTI